MQRFVSKNKSTRVSLVADCTTFSHDNLMQMSAVESGPMACQDGVTSAFLTFLTSISVTVQKFIEKREERSTKHKRGIGHAGPLPQPPFTPTPSVSPYTAFNSRCHVTTRRSPHDTTLSCLFLNKETDAVALHDCNLTEGFSRAWATC